ncbi:hypothetical protein QTP70_017255, partial [Hemibagrus guttatus]
TSCNPGTVMHGLPCSSLQYCFGAPADVSPEPAPHLDSEPGRIQPNASTSPVILTQPQAASLTEPQHQPAVRSQHTKTNGTRAKEPALVLHSSPSSEGFPEEEMPHEESPVQNTKYTHIPRPSIIRSPQEQECPLQEEQADCTDCIETEDGPLSGLNQSELPTRLLPRVRTIMAEPDYMDGDCDELIKPKKIINPVKTSRNHQDLHRELLMNQKRGLAPQNKPELQKVMEKRKRDQVLKAQLAEQEAHKKQSDLEIELMKRQQKLEQLELEQQKMDEEQENTPEFVKMKSNLRRTKQEVEEQERTT